MIVVALTVTGNLHCCIASSLRPSLLQIMVHASVPTMGCTMLTPRSATVQAVTVATIVKV